MLAASALKGHSHSSLSAKISKEVIEHISAVFLLCAYNCSNGNWSLICFLYCFANQEEVRRAQDAEREKRAAAAERRLAAAAALKAQGTGSVSAPSGSATDILCSCCNGSLAGKVPFHRYNYKYCSTACMHVHKEILEDG